MDLFEWAVTTYGKPLGWRDKFVLISLDSGQSSEDVERELRKDMLRRGNADKTILAVAEQYVATWSKRLQTR